MDIQPVSLPPSAVQPDQRAFVKKDLLAAAQKKVTDAKEAPARKVAQLELDALKAEFKTETLTKDSEEWKTAAKETLKLQRAAKLTAAKLKLTTANLAEVKAQEALTKAETGKDKAAITKAKTAKSVGFGRDFGT